MKLKLTFKTKDSEGEFVLLPEDKFADNQYGKLVPEGAECDIKTMTISEEIEMEKYKGHNRY